MTIISSVELMNFTLYSSVNALNAANKKKKHNSIFQVLLAR